jgi:hypothetical protein
VTPTVPKLFDVFVSVALPVPAANVNVPAVASTPH